MALLRRVNVSRGGFRLWVVLTALWLAFVAFLAWDEVSIATRGRYQYAPEMRDGIENSFDQEHIAKPFAEVFKKPSEARQPPHFSRVEYEYRKGFDEAVTSGNLLLVDFPDGTQLYLNSAFEKPERDLVGRRFWERRWGRRLDALGQEGSLIGLALVPPLLLLAAWFVGRWVLAWFRQA